MWDPQQYLRHADHRSRPFFELIARVGADSASVRSVVDLGCGPGNLTIALADVWPNARVLGLDSSSAMIDDANARVDATSRVRFELGDLSVWNPPGDGLDVVVSNATLQWVPDHVRQLERLVSWLVPGGWFAFQVPGNFRSPSHVLLSTLRQSPRWSDRVGAGADRHLAVLEPAQYAELLTGLGCSVDAWETTYVHILVGDDPVLDWVKGTGLRPVLAALEPHEADEFCREYGALLREAYPAQPWGTAFPFRRIFVVARRAP